MPESFWLSLSLIQDTSFSLVSVFLKAEWIIKLKGTFFFPKGWHWHTLDGSFEMKERGISANVWAFTVAWELSMGKGCLTTLFFPSAQHSVSNVWTACTFQCSVRIAFSCRLYSFGPTFSSGRKAVQSPTWFSPSSAFFSSPCWVVILLHFARYGDEYMVQN